MCVCVCVCVCVLGSPKRYTLCFYTYFLLVCCTEKFLSEGRAKLIKTVCGSMWLSWKHLIYCHFVSLLCSIMVTESSSWPQTGTTLMRCLWTDGVVDGVEMDRNWCVACDTHVLCLCVWMGVDGHEKDVTYH